MYKLAAFAAMWLALAPAWAPQQDAVRNECIQRCLTEPIDPEIQRQEIVNLEREAARAIQLGDGTYFRRVYADDFAGTLSRGEPVNKAGFPVGKVRQQSAVGPVPAGTTITLVLGF